MSWADVNVCFQSQILPIDFDGGDITTYTDWEFYVGCQNISSLDTFNYELTGLTTNRYYKYRVLAEYGEDNSYHTNEIVMFMEEPDSPQIETLTPTLVSSIGANLRGDIISLGDYTSVDVRFEWEEYLEGDWQTTNTQTKSSTGQFVEDVNISADSEYRYRASYYNELTSEWLYSDYVIFNNTVPPPTPEDLTSEFWGLFGSGTAKMRFFIAIILII